MQWLVWFFAGFGVLSLAGLLALAALTYAARRSMDSETD